LHSTHLYVVERKAWDNKKPFSPPKKIVK
jgi:hypothetical protein